MYHLIVEWMKAGGVTVVTELNPISFQTMVFTSYYTMFCCESEYTIEEEMDPMPKNL